MRLSNQAADFILNRRRLIKLPINFLHVVLVDYMVFHLAYY